MGRPLNKKYFGNFNIGTNGYTPVPGGNIGGDDGIGGEGVASYGTIVAGSGWTTIPTVTFSAPDIPGGVSVAGIAHYKALSFSTTANGTGYAVGNVLEVDTGTQTTKARAPVAAILSVATPNITNGGSLYDITDVNVGDKVTFTHANLTTALRVRITAVSGSTATAIEVEQAGIWNGTTFPSSMANGVGGFTATTTARPGGDTNGNGLVLGFTLSMWGVYSFGTVSTLGDYTVFPSTGASGTLTSISPATGTGAKADITMGLLSIAVTQKGSGYTTPADAAVSFTGSTGAAATAVLTTDVGTKTAGTNLNVATNQNNAIIIHANVGGEGSTLIGDIQEQVGSRRYRVKTADDVKVCKLVADDTPGTKQAYIKATDDNGNTYFVIKLTAHRATLIQWSNNESTWLYADNAVAGWTFGSAVAPGDAVHSLGLVTIENA